MYMLLGHIIEKLGGDTWESILNEKILQPLGMSSTVVMRDVGILETNNVAKPYVYHRGQFLNGTRDIYK